jgi:hypothetical protein
MENNQKKDHLSIVDYKLISSLLGLNTKRSLVNQKMKKTKENELYLIKMKNNIETKYKSFTNIISKYVNNKKKLNIEKDKKNCQEKILSFNNISTQKFNKTYNRYINRDKQYKFLDKVKKIIKIQSTYRSYSFKKEFYKGIKEKLRKKCEDSIIKIQTFIRQKLAIKHIKIKMIQNLIILSFKKKEKLIENSLINFYYQIKFKQSFLTEDLIRRRNESIIKIQSIFRGNQIYKKIQHLIKKMKTLYTITYPFYANEVEIKIHVLMNNIIRGKFGELEFSIRTYKFEYNSILKLFILFIEPKDLEPGKYRCQFIVNKIITYDGRYPYIEFSDGKFYNLINFRVNNILNVNRIDEIEQESPSDDIDNTNQSLNNGKNKIGIRDDFSSYEDLKTNLESNVCTSRMEYIQKKSLTDLIDFD